MIFRTKKTTSSRLRHRLTLQQESRSDDGAGGYTRSWVDVADLWAEIIPTRGREVPFGTQLESQITHRIVLRYRDGVSAGQRFVFEGRAFNIRSVMNAQELDDVLEILAEEGVAA